MLQCMSLFTHMYKWVIRNILLGSLLRRQRALLVIGRPGEKKKKKWGDIFCSHCPLRAYYFLIIATFIEDIPRESFYRGETTALGVTLGWTSKPYLGRDRTNTIKCYRN